MMTMYIFPKVRGASRCEDVAESHPWNWTSLEADLPAAMLASPRGGEVVVASPSEGIMGVLWTGQLAGGRRLG
jgi:hypothetical protein